MAKAAGYMSKGSDDDSQGKVTGNRYGISSCAPPGWETYAIKQLHCMSQLIVDVYDHLTVKYGDKYRERKGLNNYLEKIPKDKKPLRNSIGKKLAAVRQELNALPVRCNKYQVLLKSQGDFFRFMSWAVSDTDNGNDWLPKKEAGLAYNSGRTPEAKDSLYHTKLREKIKHRKLWRRLDTAPTWVQWCDSQWQQIKMEYESFAGRFIDDDNPVQLWANMEPGFFNNLDL